MKKYLFLNIIIMVILTSFGCAANNNIDVDVYSSSVLKQPIEEVYTVDLGELSAYNPVPEFDLYGNDHLYMAGLFMENGSKIKIMTHSNDSFQDVVNYYAWTIGETVDSLIDYNFFIMEGNLIKGNYPVQYEFFLKDSIVKTTITMDIKCDDVFWGKINDYWKDNVIWDFENDYTTFENQSLRYFYQESIILTEINYRYDKELYDNGLDNYKKMISSKIVQNHIDVIKEEDNGLNIYIWDEDNVRATIECNESESLITLSQLTVMKE